MSGRHGVGVGLVANVGFVLAVMMMVSVAAEADEQGQWTVSRLEGTVEVADAEGNRRNMQVGDVLSGGDRVYTGIDGYVTLVANSDEINADPGTEFEVSGTSANTPHTILQTLGRMLYRMESRETRNFSVGTPYLAAAIKGTVFTVDVRSDAASVTVAEGSVEVTVAQNGVAVMVDQGGQATVTSGGVVRTDRADGDRSEKPGKAERVDRPQPASSNAKVPDSQGAAAAGGPPEGAGVSPGTPGNGKSRGKKP